MQEETGGKKFWGIDLSASAKSIFVVLGGLGVLVVKSSEDHHEDTKSTKKQEGEPGSARREANADRRTTKITTKAPRTPRVGAMQREWSWTGDDDGSVLGGLGVLVVKSFEDHHEDTKKHEGDGREELRE